jgi:hypothetical protein
VPTAEERLKSTLSSRSVLPKNRRTTQGADDIWRDMAEYREWNRKGAVLSDVPARKEYGVTRDFIVKGIQVGKLEYREGAVWGNPYIRVLRSQLELYNRRAWFRILGEQKIPDRIANNQQGDCRSQEKTGCS